jgi:hypothetical protein
MRYYVFVEIMRGAMFFACGLSALLLSSSVYLYLKHKIRKESKDERSNDSQ